MDLQLDNNMNWEIKNKITELINNSSKKILSSKILSSKIASNELFSSQALSTLKIRSFGIFKIPLIFAVSPKVIKLNKQECQIKIPLNYFTKNHENSMYFGALSIGADLAGGLLALHIFEKEPYHFLFKDVHGQFFKRCESDAYFYCNDGLMIAEKAEEAKRTGARVNIPLSITVFAPKTLGDQTPCAHFSLTLSIKLKTQ